MGTDHEDQRQPGERIHHAAGDDPEASGCHHTVIHVVRGRKGWTFSYI